MPARPVPGQGAGPAAAPEEVDTLVFSHGNSFPAGTYRVLMDAWRAAGWQVLAVERFGHDPAYPVGSNWPRLRAQLTDFIAAQAPGRRVALVGHSLGGFLSLMTACRRPDLAAAVVLLDSPLLTGWRAHSVHVAKLSGLIRRVSPGRTSHKRRMHWPSAAAAHAHFAAKHAFARWDPRVLADYIAAGTEPDPTPGATPGSVQLAFKREIETRIYETLPHTFGRLLQRHPPQCPVAFIGGTQSVEVRRVGLATTRAVTHGRIEWIEGSHLFPMERPDETAQAVLGLLHSLLPGCEQPLGTTPQAIAA